jgi:Holliday junction resolvase
MNLYKIGYYYENRVVKYLRKLGYDAWRTPASKSPIDVVAIHPIAKRILLIQIKATSKDDFSLSSLSKKEKEKLIELAQRYKDYPEVSVELWVFLRKQRHRKVFDIKRELLSNM